MEDEEFKDEVLFLTEAALDKLFVRAHKLAGTNTGDISPEMMFEFNELKKLFSEKLAELVIRQVDFNR